MAHPKSKLWQCGDHAIALQRDRSKWLVAAVKRGAECNTDYHLLHVKSRMKIATPCGLRRFDVSKLDMSSGDDSTHMEPSQREAFREQLVKVVKASWPMDDSGDEKWNVMKSSLTETASSMLVMVWRCHRDWFKESTRR